MQNDNMIYKFIASNHNYNILKSALNTVNEFLKDGYKIYLCGNKTITLDEPFDDFYEMKIEIID